MKRLVVDASVIAAVFLQDVYAEAAKALIGSGRELHAPDLIYAELASAVWKSRRRGEIDREEAQRLLEDFMTASLRITPCVKLVGRALDIALETGRTVYDCLYLALAVETGSVMVTGDRRLVNSLARTPLVKYVAWIGD